MKPIVDDRESRNRPTVGGLNAPERFRQSANLADGVQPTAAVRRDRLIAGLLWHGTWLASSLIAVGVLLTIVGSLSPSIALPLGGNDVVIAGVAVFILLPIARVALMLIIFLRERDYAYTVIAALVLAIIAAGVIIEL